MTKKSARAEHKRKSTSVFEIKKEKIGKIKDTIFASLSNQNYSENKCIKTFVCPKCSKILKNSSSFGKHLRQVHGQKWQCPYCDKQYSDKGSHQICAKKDEKLKIKLVKSYMNKSDPISFLFLKKKLFLIVITWKKVHLYIL